MSTKSLFTMSIRESLKNWHGSFRSVYFQIIDSKLLFHNLSNEKDSLVVAENLIFYGNTGGTSFTSITWKDLLPLLEWKPSFCQPLKIFMPKMEPLILILSYFAYFKTTKWITLHHYGWHKKLRFGNPSIARRIHLVTYWKADKDISIKIAISRMLEERFNKSVEEVKVSQWVCCQE